MPSSARITVLGHITQPEAKVLPSGTDAVEFSVATDAYNKAGNITSWWRITVMGNRSKGLMTLMNNGSFTKGTLVQVTGEVTQRKWTNKDGQERVNDEVFADSVEVIFTKSDQQQGGGNYDNAPF